MQMHPFRLNIILSLPPFHAVTMNLMPSRRQPPGDLIYSLFRPSFDPGIDGIVDISYLHQCLLSLSSSFL
jgi:hypothetical protein